MIAVGERRGDVHRAQMLLEFVTLALPLGRFLSCLVSFEPPFFALSNGTHGTEIRPLVTEVFTFYFVLLITPKPSPGFLAFDLACLFAYADLRLPTFHTPQLCYIVATSFRSPFPLTAGLQVCAPFEYISAFLSL